MNAPAPRSRSRSTRVYQQVLTEGTTADVARYIDAEQLLELWDHLVLLRPGPSGLGRLVRHHHDVDVDVDADRTRRRRHHPRGAGGG